MKIARACWRLPQRTTRSYFIFHPWMRDETIFHPWMKNERIFHPSMKDETTVHQFFARVAKRDTVAQFEHCRETYNWQSSITPRRVHSLPWPGPWVGCPSVGVLPSNQFDRTVMGIIAYKKGKPFGVSSETNGVLSRIYESKRSFFFFSKTELPDRCH